MATKTQPKTQAKTRVKAQTKAQPAKKQLLPTSSSLPKSPLLKHDTSRMFDVLQGFPEQVRQGIAIGSKAPYFNDTTPFRALVFSGMGGSAIGGDLLRCCLAAHGVDEFSVNVSRGYELPSGVNADTAVVASSYSGATEETLAAFDAARKKTKRLLCISTGGELSTRAKKNNVPVIQIPSGLQPRCAVGLSFFPLLTTLLDHNAINKKSTAELRKAIRELLPLLDAKASIYAVPDAKKNPAFALAEKLHSTIPIFYSAPLLEAVNMRWRGQFQENAKHIAFGNIVPEMNHNEINGWTLPTQFTKQCSIVLLRHDGEHGRIATRFDAMKPILKKRTKQVIEVHAEGSSFLTQAFMLLYLGDWVSYWLALLGGQDPTTIDDILALKAHLSKR